MLMQYLQIAINVLELVKLKIHKQKVNYIHLKKKNKKKTINIK